MPVKLEKSEFLTEYEEAPKPVPGNRAFASLITGKLVKGLVWIDGDDGITIMFTDQSRVSIGAGPHGPELRYITGPPNNIPWTMDSAYQKSW